MRIVCSAVVGFLALLVPCAAQAAPEWVGDFETGDLSQWSQVAANTGNADHITVTQQVVRDGAYAGRIELHPDDVAPGGLTRNELLFEPGQPFEDTERYYAVSLRRESSEDWGDSWHLLWFWEGNPVFTDALSLNALGPSFQYQSLVGGATDHWDAAFPPDVWHDFVLHVYWSADPSTGFFELYYDGDIVVPKTKVATLVGAGVPNSMHVGLVRDQAIGQNEVVYIDAARAGETLQDVMPDGGGGSGGGDGGSDGMVDGTAGGDGADGAADGGGNDGGGASGGAGDGATGGSNGDATAAGSGGDGGSGCSCGVPTRRLPIAWALLGVLALVRRR